MRLKGFDRVGLACFLGTCIFTVSMAITQWQWSSADPGWDYIATVPRTIANGWALLGPFVVALIWSLSRRMNFWNQR